MTSTPLLLARLRVPDAPFQKAVVDTLMNGTVLPAETRGSVVDPEQCNYHRDGLELRRENDGTFTLETWTVEGGVHKPSALFRLDARGKMVKGRTSQVNCFALGWMKADKGYLSEMLDELEARDELPWKLFV